MGGSSYDRDVYGSSSGWGSYGSSKSYSYDSDKALGSTSLDSSMQPLDRRIKSNSKHPIVIMLDVTGSNTSFAKIVYDKMPMFFGQIEQKGYLNDFDISVCAIGDAHCDDYPLQIADFAKGTEIDTWLSKLVLEGGGGGQTRETYELGAYYLLNNFDYDTDASPIVFFLGDEKAYAEVSPGYIKKYIDSTFTGEAIRTKLVFDKLLEKIPNTFLFLNPYCGRYNDKDIKDDWEQLFGDKSKNIIFMQEDNEKAIVDLLLGTIALINDRDLESYKVDMLDRGQTNARIESVDRMLTGLSNSLVPTATVNGLQKSDSAINKRNSKNNRL